MDAPLDRYRLAINDPEYFFGRTDLISEILGSPFEVRIILGGRRLGKTSLLNAVRWNLLEANEQEHRKINFPVVHQGIEQLTNLAIEKGISTFLTGMAIGTDQLAAEVWITRQLTWKAILPCPDQSALWPSTTQLHYRNLLTKASEIKVLYPKFERGVMQGRNQYLVRHSNRKGCGCKETSYG